MFKIIIKLSEGLERLKGFNTGYSTNRKDSMLIEVEGKVYLLSVKELGDGKVDDYFDNL